MMQRKLLACAAVSLLLSACDKTFWDTVEEQKAQGYKWKEIPCRQVENYPAITIDTPTGKKLVCNVLVK